MDIIETVLYSKPDADNVELIDGDWTDNYGLILVLKENGKFVVQIGDSKLMLPNFTISCTYPLVRWIDNNCFLIADARNEDNTENLYIINLDGTVLNSFHCGDGIEDIVVSNDGIWISYFDEGVFGHGISTEGLVLFSIQGESLFRYHSDLLDRPSIVDCYAICKGTSPSLWLFPYIEFPLLNVNPTKKTVETYKVPKVLHGSNGICVRGRFAYFYDRYNSNGEVYCWEFGSKRPQLVGHFNGTARGLDPSETNHFISIDDNLVKAYRIIHNEEY
ncbi:TetR family transcriptional regulator [Ornithinibacillus sp. L9]|uniref:TetR family transcriptional regulator n=2 Tax=Ornithinibacillus caprae TaxID=2678566 RepID=A0A6N8FEW0_9BACI|nr:TetR family transcriptional regulator [Ornithinibacillus caprae]